MLCLHLSRTLTATSIMTRTIFGCLFIHLLSCLFLVSCLLKKRIKKAKILLVLIIRISLGRLKRSDLTIFVKKDCSKFNPGHVIFPLLSERNAVGSVAQNIKLHFCICLPEVHAVGVLCIFALPGPQKARFSSQLGGRLLACHSPI